MYLDENDSPYLYEVPPGPDGPFPERPPGRKTHTLNAWEGALLFFVFMVIFLLAGVPLVWFGGMYGNALAELLAFLAGPLLIIAALGLDRRKVLPVGKPGPTELLATVLLWIISYRAVTAVTSVIAYLFPEPYLEVSDSMSGSIYTMPFAAAVVVVGIVPAISEEVLHRGLLMYSFEKFRRRWLVILIMGIYFGIFHMSLVRFLPMMLLGLSLAYLREKTGNMVYPSLFHFLNNAWALVAMYFGGLLGGLEADALAELTSIPLASIGISLLTCAIAPVGLTLVSWLLDYPVHGGSRPMLPRGRWRIAGLILSTAAFLAIGGLLVFAGVLQML